MPVHLLLLPVSPLRPSLDRFLTSCSFSISLSGSLFTTRLTRVNLTPVSLPTPMKGRASASVLPRTKETSSLGRSLPLILRRSSSLHISEVPFQPPLTRGLLCCKGSNTRLVSHQNLLFKPLPLLIYASGLMPTLKFSNLLGRTFLCPAQENGAQK